MKENPMHPTHEQISAFIDGEAAAPDRDRLKNHCESCPECAATKARFERTAIALGALELPEPTTDQHRKLRQAILDQQVKRHFFLGRPAVAGGLAVALLAAIAIASIRSPRPQQDQTGSLTSGGMAIEEQSFDFESDAEIRSSVVSLPEVTEARFTTEDVGTEQEGAYSAAADSSEAEENALDASAGGSQQASGQQATSRAAGSSIDPQAAGTTCSRKILKTQPYPMIPLLIRHATYKQQSAWLLVYAWTASQERNAPLDQVQVWLVDPAKCAELSGDDLAGAAYHYSSFKRT